MAEKKKAEVVEDAPKWAWHRMRLNPERPGTLERVVFPGAQEDGSDLVVATGEVVTIPHSVWERVKEQTDAQGRRFLARA